MKIVAPTLAFAAAVAAPLAAAHAAASDWHHAEGGAVRLVTQNAPDSEGKLRGALEIRLNPGWKTYWVDPGSSGVPPTLDVSVNGTPVGTVMSFPAPERFDDGYTEWAGYNHSVALAVELDLSQHQDALPHIEAHAFFGLCETICIPVQAAFSLDLGASGNHADDAVVDLAFKVLPAPAREGFEVTSVAVEETGITLQVSVPEGAKVKSLYLAGTDRLMFETPLANDAGTAFSIPFMGRGKPKGGERLLYSLRTSAGDVTGHLTLP